MTRLGCVEGGETHFELLLYCTLRCQNIRNITERLLSAPDIPNTFLENG